ncbi:MAG: HD domain-containing phosphohydrolase [Oscillochloridaceae bacterium umkhey_bin13]
MMSFERMGSDQEQGWFWGADAITSLRHQFCWRAALIVLGYTLCATTWLLVAALRLTPQPLSQATFYGLWPELAFVACSALLLFLLLNYHHLRQQRNEQQLHVLAEHVPDMIFRLQVYPTCRFTYVSPAAQRLTGYAPADFYANPDLVYRLVHPDDRARLAALTSGRPEAMAPAELRWMRQNGSLVWIEQRTVPIYADDGRLIAFEGIAREITERKSAEEQIVWQRRALERAHTALIDSYNVTLSGWSQALDLRDHETEGHSSRVTYLSVRLAQQMGFEGEELEHFRRGALLHDIGKIGIPDAVLHKPGPLDDSEWVVMRRHPEYAYDLLAPIGFLRPALDIPYCHHERWDGSGYPRGLCGEQIPLAARIFAVVDVWDALTNHRPYRNAWSPERVRAYLEANAGTLFDPAVVHMFLGLPELASRSHVRTMVQRRVA